MRLAEIVQAATNSRLAAPRGTAVAVHAARAIEDVDELVAFANNAEYAVAAA